MARMLAAALLACALAGGCGTQGVLLGTNDDRLFTAQDSLALPGEEVPLSARFQKGDLLEDQLGCVVLFGGPDGFLCAAQTDSDGLARALFRPDAEGDYLLTARLSPNGLDESPPEAAPLLVACRKPDAPMVIVDIDKTLVASDFREVLFGRASAMPDSPQVMGEVARRFTPVYLTHRSYYFGPKTRAFLSRQGYPRGPLLMSNSRQYLSGSERYKAQVLADLCRRFTNVRYGIGDKPSDARLYDRFGMTAVLLIRPEEFGSIENLRRLAQELEALPPQVQTVANWRQVREIILEGRTFQRAERLSAIAKRIETLRAQAATATATATSTGAGHE